MSCTHSKTVSAPRASHRKTKKPKQLKQANRAGSCWRNWLFNKGSAFYRTVQNGFADFLPNLLAHLLLLLLSRFSHVRLCATPQTAAYQAPPPRGFSRQEQWSGLPFPSPMHEREKSKWSRSVLSDSSRPHGLQPTRLLCPWDFPGTSTGVGCQCLLWLTFYYPLT